MDDVTIAVELARLSDYAAMLVTLATEPTPAAFEGRTLTVDALTAQHWVEATKALQASRVVFETALQEWNRATQLHAQVCGTPVNALFEMERDAEREARAARDAAVRAAEEAARAAEGAALDAKDGPEVFWSAEVKLTKKAKQKMYSIYDYRDRMVHLVECRHSGFVHASSYRRREVMRAPAAMELLTHGAAWCGTCKPERRIAAINPALAGPLAKVQEERNAKARSVTVRLVGNVLRTQISAMWTNATSGRGTDGFVAEKTWTGNGECVAVTYNIAGIGPTEWNDHELNLAVQALLKANFHVELIPAYRSPGRGGVVEFNKILVTGTSPAQDKEGLYATLDSELLLRALKLGVRTQEALEAARTGQFSEESVALLEALGAGTTEEMNLLSV